MIPPETVARILETADITEVVGDFVNLKRAGTNYKGNCPFHDEKTPSFMVSPAKQVYKCFGCGASGKPVKFIMEHEKLSYPDALKYLARKYNIEIQERELTTEEASERMERESLMIVTEFARTFFIEQLHNSDEGRTIGLSYFRERGFTDAVIKKFDLGWSPRTSNALSQAGITKGYQQKFLEKVGLTIHNQERDYLFDRFAERVIFPIHSLSGQAIAFGGRTLRTDKKVAKYLNSPESEIYHKSNVLYGIFQAKEAIRKHDLCYLTEGYTDVISMHQAGIENVVASSGTSLTREQLKLIRRFTKNLTILYDGDAAGINAALKGTDLALSLELDVKVILLPDGDDPDSFARKHTTEEISDFLSKNSVSFILFKADILKNIPHNEPVKRAQMLTDIVKTISEIPNHILRTEYIRECSNALSIKEEYLYEELTRLLTQKYESVRKSNFKERDTHTAYTPALPKFIDNIYSEQNEKELLYYLFNYGIHSIAEDEHTGEKQTVANFIISELKNENLEFRNLIYQKIFEEYDRLFLESEAVPTDYFLEHEDDTVRDVTMEIVSPQRELSKLWEKRGSSVEQTATRLHELVPDAVEKYKLKLIQVKIEQIIVQLNSVADNPETMKQLLDDMLFLDRLKIELLKFTDKTALL